MLLSSPLQDELAPEALDVRQQKKNGNLKKFEKPNATKKMKDEIIRV